ncbi:MAG: hypothetical protein QM652_14125 [Legionella sp.]|uniref:hypothetical protein n=1 Tax=Legionella sp. TaxID=459 RepID=UPI0039E4C6BE
MKKSILLSWLLPISIHANAYSTSSGPFYFSGGTVFPKTTLSIPLRQLLPIEEETPIVITCDIENPNYNNPYPVVIKLSTYKTESNVCSLNGVTSSTKLYLLNNKINKYRVHTTYSYWETLNFQNYDETNLVSVTNCMATYDFSYQ